MSRMTLVGLVACVLVSAVAAINPRQDPANGPAETKSVLLLTDGRVLRGTVQEVDDGYVVHHKVGVIHKRRRDAWGAFVSLEAAYEFQLARIPAKDPDEHLRLALWCMEQQLKPQARVELERVVEIAPDYPRAKQMLASLELRPDSLGTDDPDVQRTRADAIDAPGTLRGVDRLREQYNAAGRNLGVPIIFDLPPAQAVKRYREFEQRVHPLLQQTCARCHHEDAASSFQLVQARSKTETFDQLVVRANLDATLRLINPEDPARSALLTAAGMTHGPEGKPVLSGPNHPSYRVFAAWAANLRSPNSVPTEMPVPPQPIPGAMNSPAGQSESFAANRRVQTSQPAPANFPLPAHNTPPSSEDIPEFRAPSVPADATFPQDNPLAQPPRPMPVPKTAAAPVAPANAAGATPPPNPNQPLPKGAVRLPTGEIVLPSGEVILPSGERTAPVTRDDTLKSATKKTGSPPAGQSAKGAPPEKTKAKSSQALEQFLKNRGKTPD